MDSHEPLGEIEFGSGKRYLLLWPRRAGKATTIRNWVQNQEKETMNEAIIVTSADGQHEINVTQYLNGNLEQIKHLTAKRDRAQALAKEVVAEFEKEQEDLNQRRQDRLAAVLEANGLDVGTVEECDKGIKFLREDALDTMVTFVLPNIDKKTVAVPLGKISVRSAKPKVVPVEFADDLEAMAAKMDDIKRLMENNYFRYLQIDPKSDIAANMAEVELVCGGPLKTIAVESTNSISISFTE